VSDVGRSQRTTRNTSIKSRDAQDPVPILVTGLVKIIGVGLASAILVDVTIGRMLLVPAAMALLGARNWYLPRWLHRMLTRQVAVHRARVRQPLSSQADEPASGGDRTWPTRSC
jgi:hypothetical protein